MTTNKRIVKIVIVVAGLFLSASLVGHWIEIIWINLGIGLFGSPDQFSVLGRGWFHLAPVYGVGAICCGIVGYIVSKKLSNPVIKILTCFILCTILCSIVEYATAAIIVAGYGYNPYWDYSNMNFNIDGYICLRNSLLFGVLGTAFSLSSIPTLLGDWITESR